MSDCSKNAWKLPKRADMEPGVLYMPQLDVDGVREIDAHGVRYERVRECEFEWRGCGDGLGAWYCTACDEYVDDDEPNALFCSNCGARVKEGEL